MFAILNVNKPANMTSRGVLNQVIRALRPEKVKAGHAGTLDPLARGVLLCCLGPATRLVPFLHQLPKTYVGTFEIGKSSNTGDIYGDVETVPIPESLTAESMRDVLPEFIGEIQQRPPAFSAIRINGTRAYHLARRGEEVEVPVRTVSIARCELLNFNETEFQLEIECGTGTYIRSIGSDIAKRLGTDAVMSKLERTSIGPFRSTDAIDGNELSRELIEQKQNSPIDGIPYFTQHALTDGEIHLIVRGMPLTWPPEITTQIDQDNPLALIDSAGELVALGKPKKGMLAPFIVFRSQN